MPAVAALSGVQAPRIEVVPSFGSSAGREAVDLARSAGLVLDPWQARVLERSLGERPDGTWAAFEVGVIVSRQNGKGSILEARELAGLFLFGEELILHSAHEFKTAAEAFRRVLSLVENTDALRKRVMRVRTSHGDEGIELRTGQRLRFVARSTGSGRGFSGDCVILDEAYNLGANAMAALLPTLSARPNPQLWYTSSAGMPDSQQLTAVRERALKGGEGSLAYFEWSADEKADLDDREAWAQANPALGIRITEDFIVRERAAMPDLEFARERLGIWEDTARAAVIPLDLWAELGDEDSSVVDPVAFAVDTTPDRAWTSIGSAGAREDGLCGLELIEHKRGTGWVVDRLADLRDRWRPCAVVVDPASAAGSLIPDLQEAGIEVVTPSARDVAAACGALYDEALDRKLRHRTDPRLDAALRDAAKRPLGDAWAWDRKNSGVISPLVAVTLARWGWVTNRGNDEAAPNIW